MLPRRLPARSSCCTGATNTPGAGRSSLPPLAAPGTAVFAWDARGHGRSPGERGDAESFSVYVRDLEAFARHLGETHGLPLREFRGRRA